MNKKIEKCREKSINQLGLKYPIIHEEEWKLQSFFPRNGKNHDCLHYIAF